MDILMLGHSEAGKTSYMAAMYELMATGVGGFTVRAERPQDHRTLVQNAHRLRTGSFPNPSNRRSVYQLRLLHDKSPVLDFVWRDYRGGALTENSSSPQAVQLRADAAKANGLVLMIDSTELTGGPRGLARVRPLVSTTMRLLKERDEVLALVIVLTKWDLVRATETQTQKAAEQAFGSLIDAVSGTQHILGALIPVACGPQQFNVEQPVLWSLHVGIAVRGLLLQNSIEQKEREARFARSKDSTWDRMRSWWVGEQSWVQIAQAKEAEAYTEVLNLQPLIAPSQQLASLLAPIEKF